MPPAPPTIIPSTELDAVNAMLRSIMEQPVDTLENLSAPDAGAALAQLREASRDVQLVGWFWNTDEEYVLTPDSSGFLTLPVNTLKVILPDDQPLTLVQRGNRMYDSVNHTYVFTVPVKVALITGLNYEDMPEAARSFVKFTAMVRFQQGTIGSAQLDKFDEMAMARALASLEAAEAETSRYNILTGSWDVFKIIQRTSPPA